MDAIVTDFSDLLDPPSIQQSIKAARRRQRREQRTERDLRRNPPQMVPMNGTQAQYIAYLDFLDQVFAVGGAGTGKTYIAARHALRSLIEGRTTRIVITRPTVSKPKHRMGFLPGNADAKLAPWLTPIMDGFRAEASAATIDKMKKDGQIEFLPFEHMRGRSIIDSVIILDEAQNCDLGDLRLFLTRVGKDSQVIVCGDTDQVDIPDSGLNTVLDMIERHRIEAGVIRFLPSDVVRSGIARAWVEAFARDTA